jgi:dihydrofolate reductase
VPIIYNAATTLNGFLADDHDSLQWLFDVPGADDAEADNQAFLASVDALVMGSTTYEWLLDALDSPAELTAQYGDWPIWVFTSRDLPVPDGSRVRLVGGAVAEALPAIRATGDTIWVMAAAIWPGSSTTPARWTASFSRWPRCSSPRGARRCRAASTPPTCASPGTAGSGSSWSSPMTWRDAATAYNRLP